MKHLFLSIFMMLSVVFHTQGQTKAEFKSAGVLAQPSISQPKSSKIHIQDAETGETLPYVSVYSLKESSGTISNAEGDCRVSYCSDDTLRFSYIGYETLSICVDDIRGVVELNPIADVLKEIEVRGYDGLIQRLAKKFENEYNKQRRSKKLYFLRQSNWVNGRLQILESFVKAHSAVSVDNLSFVAGKHYMDSSDDETIDDSGLLWFSNLHYLLSLSPYVKNKVWSNVLVTPFNVLLGFVDESRKKEYYNTEVEKMTKEDGSVILKLSFHAGEINDLILCGNLYVEEKSLRPIAFDGHLENFQMKIMSKSGAKITPAQVNLHINFCDGKDAYHITDLAVNLQSKEIKISTLLHDVNESLPGIGDGISGYDNMIDAINNSISYDDLWENEVVMKTTEEQNLANKNAPMPSIMLGNASSVSSILETLQDNFRKYPQEKVYLHLDNRSYFLGDTIWFKAYTRQTDTSSPSTISNVLYVELLNHDGYPVEQKKVQLHSGEGIGNFALKADSSMYSGFYEIRAYTSWQRNWGQHVRSRIANSNYWFYNKKMADDYFMDYEKVYSRVFPVYDKPLIQGDIYRDMTLRRTMRYYGGDSQTEVRPVVKFYPEGGNLVAGVINHVAFEATTEEGEYLDGHLEVNGQEYSSYHRGRGEFDIIPESTKRISGLFRYGDGKTVQVQIPQPQLKGVAMHVSQDEDLVSVRICRQGFAERDTLGCCVMHEGNLLAFQQITDTLSLVNFQNDILKCGVNQITVFDKTGRVWADRLFFNIPDSLTTPTLLISGNEEEYSPMSQVNLKISSTSKVAGHPSCSVAVRDKSAEDTTYDDGNILTEMLLSSEIKGFVPDADWYFRKRDKEHCVALDLLMLTQGWRRFDFVQTLTGDVPQIPAEKNLRLYGNVLRYRPYHKENKIELRNVKFSLTQKEPQHRESDDKDRHNFQAQAADLYSRPHGNSPFSYSQQHSHDRNNNSFSSSNHQSQDKNENKSFTNPNQHDHDRLAIEGSIEEQDMNNFINEVLAQDYYIDNDADLVYRGAGMRKVPRNTFVHAEFVQGRNAVKREGIASEGAFAFSVPFIQGTSVLHVSASDTTKWKKGHAHQWILPKEDEYPEFYVKLKSPFIHSVKPYSYYQIHQPLSSAQSMTDETILSDSHGMKQVSVFGKNGRLIKKQFVPPALKLDAQEAFNLVSDAGLLDGWMIGRTSFSKAIARYFIGDMGNGVNYGVEILPRQSEWENDQASSSSFLTTQFPSEFYNSDGNEQMYSFLSSLDSVYIFTDYSPRLAGSEQYNKPNVPEVIVQLKPFADNTERVTFRDRFTRFEGYSVAADFYHPDYSKHPLPEGQQDYRRTLYWNPNLQLDENGEATITFYNNSRTTRLSIEAEGQASDGTLLWGR